MYIIDFKRPARIHFIGIGGISMSGLARILMNAGFRVSGSDNNRSDLTEQLSFDGADIQYGQKAENIPEDCEAVVYSAAIHEDNPEYREAVRRGLPMLMRAELLGQLMKGYERSVAVAGTHGKTTTTSMAAHILMEAGLDPTISVGGMLPSIGGNLRIGGRKVFLTEACEYTNSFLFMFPTVSVILNVEEDHLDFFRDLDDIRNSFRKFGMLLPEDGLLIINSAIEDLSWFTKDLPCRFVTFGTDASADYEAADIVYDEFGNPSFDALRKGSVIGRFSLNVPGTHNIGNALAAIAVGCELGIPAETIRQGLLSFTGTDRRFQKKGSFHGAQLIDDYAHHPTEIQASLHAALQYPHKKLWCIFQPHTYSRTASFLDEFAEALSLADEIVLAEIYAAREVNTIGISSADLAEKVRQLGKKCVFFPTFEQIEDYILENAGPGDLVMTMGAGDVYLIGDHCLEKCK